MADAATLVEQDLRQRLRQAITAWRHKQATQNTAARAVVRAQHLVAEAETRLASFASLDEQITAHHAHAIRADEATSSLTLPVELADARSQRQQATDDLATTKATLALLEDELQQAVRAVTRAESTAASAADAILRSEADAIADELTVARAHACALEDRLHALAEARALHPRALAVLHAQRPAEPLSGNPARAAAAQSWRAYHAALLNDPDAVLRCSASEQEAPRSSCGAAGPAGGDQAL
jgi:hypothetical protein